MYQTMKEIEEQYNGKFVCIVNCKEGEYHDIIGGEVIAVSDDKEGTRKVWRENPDSYRRYCGDFGEFLGITNGGLLF